MKTLIIAPFSPYPLVFGGAIRLYHLIKMFAATSEVTLVAYRIWNVDDASVRHLESICKKVVMVDEAPLETRPKWQLQLRGMVGPKTFQYHSFYSREFQQALDRVTAQERFDTIVVEQSQMAYFQHRQPGALHILDLQNIEYELLERRVQVQRNPLKRAALALEAIKFKRAELALCRQFDMVFTPSDRERDHLRRLLAPIPVETLANSIDPDFFALRPLQPLANQITFIGTTHVDANRDGLCYFMDEMFPLIEAKVPDVHFSIVGGKPPADVRAFGQRPNVTVTGFVDDVRPYMAAAKALVVPLRSGGGTRLKIMEGLSFGVPTVSTSVGAEGISVVDGEHILLGDTPEAFAAHIVRVLNDEALQQRLRIQGRQLVEETYSWQAVGRTLQRYLQAAPGRPSAGWQPSQLRSQ
ncbi:MAG: glycosyltransferase family 4 protein [Chloroflexaceae bacterium]|jgi:glycosyltransferase involved in cell wall biosynthesis|nr:glycosyltransferase family 4 protein [Chloroflexaceae bacterium]